MNGLKNLFGPGEFFIIKEEGTLQWPSPDWETGSQNQNKARQADKTKKETRKQIPKRGKAEWGAKPQGTNDQTPTKDGPATHDTRAGNIFGLGELIKVFEVGILLI